MIEKLLPFYGGFIQVALISILIVGLSILWLRFQTVKRIEKKFNDYWHAFYAAKYKAAICSLKKTTVNSSITTLSIENHYFIALLFKRYIHAK